MGSKAPQGRHSILAVNSSVAPPGLVRLPCCETGGLRPRLNSVAASRLKTAQLHKSRAGVTLTQMLVVIALTGVITTAAITTIITMLRVEGRTTQVWLSQQTLLRLSDDFRSDAHAAKFAEITTQNATPALIFQDHIESTKSVTYLVAENQVTRRETDGDKLLRTEVYRLPDSQVTFGSTTSKNDPPRMTTGETVQLNCRRPNAPPINQRTPPPLHDEHVVAVIGRDHRFEKP